MAFIVTAVIVDAQGKPLPGLDARACVYALKSNVVRAIGTGRTGEGGKLAMECGFSWPNELQPRLELQLSWAGAFVAASASPTQFSEAGCDFGTLVFPPAKPQTSSGGADHIDTSIGELTAVLGGQLRDAQARLRAERAGVRLGRVTLQLKVLPGAAVDRVALPRLSEIVQVGAEGLSQLTVDFMPDAGGAPAARAAVPRLTGYTEAMARRKLAEQRLLAEVVFELVGADAEVGRVVSQSPAAGTQVDEGATVVIATGRKG